MGWVKPKYNDNVFEIWGLKEGSQQYRIFPALHSLEASQENSKYVGIHYGFRGVDPRDKTKTRMRTFRCIRIKQRNGIILQECPQCEDYDRRKAETKEHEAALITKGVPEDQRKTEQASESAWLKNFNCDRKHYYNVKRPPDATGAVKYGWLKLSHETKKKLDDKIKKLRADESIDPIDATQGVWFDFTRIGKMGADVVDTVDVVRENVTINGRNFLSTKLAPLTEEEYVVASEQCRDLTTVGWELTYNEIKALVESNGDPEAVDRVFDSSKGSYGAPREAAHTQEHVSEPAATQAPVAPPTAPTPPAVVATPAPQADQHAAIQQRLAAIKAKQAAEVAAKRAAEEAARKAAEEEAIKAAAASAPVAAPVNDNASSLADLSDEDFMRQFG